MRNCTVCVCASTVGSTCTLAASSQRCGSGSPGNSMRTPFGCAPSAPCGTAAVTRRAPGSYKVSSARPGMAMSPCATGTSATTPA